MFFCVSGGAFDKQTPTHTHNACFHPHGDAFDTKNMAMVSSCAESLSAGVSALIHVLGLRQAAAARLGAFEDEDIDGVVFVGVAVLGGYGAIFWTTAMSPTT